MSNDSTAHQALATNLFSVALVLSLACSSSCAKQNDFHSLARKSANPAGLPPVLLFNGTGSSPNDVKAVEAVLDAIHVDYSAVNSSELNQLTEAQLRHYRLLIVPGGNFVDMGRSLTTSAADNIRSAVQNGLNYLGICGGGFLAGKYYENDGLNLTSGVKFGFYSAETKGIRKAPLAISLADGPTLEHYWEDGPEFTGWGEAVGKYPDGAPAIVQGTLGSGSIILSGVHPEAPENWRSGMSFTTPASQCNAFAGQLILAALNQTKLPTFSTENQRAE